MDIEAKLFVRRCPVSQLPGRGHVIDIIILGWRAEVPTEALAQYLGCAETSVLKIAHSLVATGILDARSRGWRRPADWQARLDALKVQEEK